MQWSIGDENYPLREIADSYLLSGQKKCGLRYIQRMRDKINKLLSTFEWRLSLSQQVLYITGLIASVSLPAWAVSVMETFTEYAPLSWVVAGFSGAFLFLFLVLLYQGFVRVKLRNDLFTRLSRSTDAVNPLDRAFHEKRIQIRDILPPVGKRITGRSFLDCDIVGPANLVIWSGNSINNPGGECVDAVLLKEDVTPLNGIVLHDCDFRNCKFYNITFLVYPGQYEGFDSHLRVPWVTEIPAELAGQGDLMLEEPSPHKKPDAPDGG